MQSQGQMRMIQVAENKKQLCSKDLSSRNSLSCGSMDFFVPSWQVGNKGVEKVGVVQEGAAGWPPSARRGLGPHRNTGGRAFHKHTHSRENPNER